MTRLRECWALMLAASCLITASVLWGYHSWTFAQAASQSIDQYRLSKLEESIQSMEATHGWLTALLIATLAAVITDMVMRRKK